ncbi:MAG: ABC transporter substrate-binding protein [Solirubrobacterales bacterium]
MSPGPQARRLFVLAILGLALLHAGCGGGDGNQGIQGNRTDGQTRATLVLDYVPNAVHAGIYRAIAAGYYEDEGIDLEVRTPSSTSDTARLLLAGRAEFGLLDGLDLGEQVSEGRPVRAVMAVLRRPAGGLVTLADSGVRTPADLAGRKVGETGAPSDRAVFQTMVESAGGDPAASEVVSIGFGGVQARVAGRIAAFTGYLPADSTAVESKGYPARSVAFARWGGPPYPGRVVATEQTTVRERPGLVRGFIRATERGYRDALADPKWAVADLAAGADGVDTAFALKAFEAYRPLIGPTEGVGRITPGPVRGLSRFMVDSGLTERRFGPARFGLSLP